MNLESPLVEHSMEAHSDQAQRFKMEVLKFVQSNLVRQSTEATKIQEWTGGKLLNRKGEWGQNLPPQLVLEDDQEPNESSKDRKKKTKMKVPEVAKRSDEDPERVVSVRQARGG